MANLYQEALRPQFHFTARYWKDDRLNPQEREELAQQLTQMQEKLQKMVDAQRQAEHRDDDE